MKDLSNENRCIYLLKVLHKTPMVAISTLASKLNVSERTIRNDMKQLNAMLQNCAVIEGKRGQYMLKVFDGAKFKVFFDEFTNSDDLLNAMQNRMDYIFEKLMHAEEPVLADELAYEMNVGRTTLMHDLKKLRAQLETYFLSIVGITGQGLVLRGRESDIRRYVLEHVYDQVYQNYPLDSEVVQIITELFSENSLEKSVQASFTKFITLMLDRFLTGHYVGELSSQFYHLTTRTEFHFVQNVMTRIEQYLHIELPIEEKLFVFLPIIGMRTPADIQDMQLIELDQSIQNLVDRILQRIQEEMNITINTGDFTKEFSYHLMFMINRLRFHVKLKNPMLDELYRKYPLACQMANTAADVVRQECDLVVSEDEKGYLASYFSVFLEESGMWQNKAYRVAVVSGTGRVTARLVAAQLRKVLDSTVELSLFAEDKVNCDLLDQYDIVLTTVELSCSCNRPVIRIYEIFNEQELIHKIEKVRYWDQIDVPVLDNNWFVMTGLLDKSRFFLLDACQTYQDAIAYMTDELAKSGQVDDGFFERLCRREEKGTMVLDAVAIPHSTQTVSSKLVLSIGIFHEPMQYQNHHIRIIFMLALPQNTNKDDDLLLRVYDEIIHITQDTQMIDKIASVTDFQTLLQALYRQIGK